MVRSLPVSFHLHRHPPTSNALDMNNLVVEENIESTSTLTSDCKYGKFYVYDLPPMLNKDLVDNCQDLNPWGSRCDALSNDGFGRRATELSGVVPGNLLQTWYWTDQFASEIIFHNRIKGHQCRTQDPESAQAFYIPFYAGLAVGKFLWSNFSAHERDFHCETMLKWVQNQKYWNRSNGWDHFIMLGRISWDFRRSKDEDWGSSFLYMPTMKNVTRLLIERNPWDYFDVGVPYPTGFHPRTDSDVKEWQNFVRTHKRNSLFSFAGGTRGTIKNDFRGFLLKHCYNESDSCRVVDCSKTRCSNGSSTILETFLESDFCLQPRGDSFTRRSIFDCMLAGSIPVFFWKRTAYYQYEWFLPVEPETYSVFIDRRDVKNGTSIRGVLEKFSKEDIRRMRDKVIEFIPRFIYAEPMDGLENTKDAFDVAIDGVLRKFKEGLRWK
ncbi:Xyloglucan galactosyltransferase xlt2 [Thalictrum thalictroides]|uniref:Xyloglucan galactosyltransferase xlt2 n=1 Tax=Thalictrum thalictroides TaxID=46969 RepID=A0A7J6X630_THATH|nr:Xyloglucan galactosyltransferase xlt2 [Thalictrum thalictroides]